MLASIPLTPHSNKQWQSELLHLVAGASTAVCLRSWEMAPLPSRHGHPGELSSSDAGLIYYSLSKYPHNCKLNTPAGTDFSGHLSMKWCGILKVKTDSFSMLGGRCDQGTCWTSHMFFDDPVTYMRSLAFDPLYRQWKMQPCDGVPAGSRPRTQIWFLSSVLTMRMISTMEHSLVPRIITLKDVVNSFTTYKRTFWT